MFRARPAAPAAADSSALISPNLVCAVRAARVLSRISQLWLVTVLVSAIWRSDVTVTSRDEGACSADAQARGRPPSPLLITPSHTPTPASPPPTTRPPPL